MSKEDQFCKSINIDSNRGNRSGPLSCTILRMYGVAS